MDINQLLFIVFVWPCLSALKIIVFLAYQVVWGDIKDKNYKKKYLFKIIKDASYEYLFEAECWSIFLLLSCLTFVIISAL